VRTLSAIVNRLSEDYEFRVITRDRDLGDRDPFPNVRPGEWTRGGKAEVMYLSPDLLSPRRILRFLRETPHDVLYLNSLCSIPFSLLPLLARRFRPQEAFSQVPVVLAPRGECAPAALALKAWKKRPVLALSRKLGLYRDVTWQASSPQESGDIRTWAGLSARILQAPDLTEVCPLTEEEALATLPPKRPGELRIVCIARIAKIKNILLAIQAVRQSRGKVTFDIYGPVEDGFYWRECLKAIGAFGSSEATIEYKGILQPETVRKTLKKYHVFILLSKGENFSHSIYEALASGRPLIISDATPWNGMLDPAVTNTTEVGSLPSVVEKLNAFVDMGEARLRELVKLTLRSVETLKDFNRPAHYEALFG